MKVKPTIMKRVLDLTFAFLIGLILLIPIICVAIVVSMTSIGPTIYWSDRVGKNNKIFRMPKFRTMQVDTPAVATHLLGEPDRYLTPVGSFLRKNSLDELPQLWSIIRGDMSFVGPRPALFNQVDLIDLRTSCGVHRMVPGLTGWAQINGRDEIPIPQKVEFDLEYQKKCSFFMDGKIIFLTALKVLKRDNVSH